MTAIVTTSIRTTQLTNFINAFNEETTSDDFKSLYLALCKDTPWDDDASGRNEDDPGFAVPLVNEDDIDLMWDDVLTFKRIFIENINPVVPECTYISGDKWAWDGLNLSSGVWEQSFNGFSIKKSVMRNSEGRVYQCIQEPLNGTCYIGGTETSHLDRDVCESNPGATWIPEKATMEPIGLPTQKGEVLTFGNYQWEYLWTLDSNTIIDKVNYWWQPISYNLYSEGGFCYIDGVLDTSHQTQESCEAEPLSNWTYTSIPFFEQDVYGIDPDLAVIKTKAINMMIETTLTSDNIGIDIDTFRQIFLVDTPYTLDNEKAFESVIQPSDMSSDVSGNVFVMENKLPAIRSEDSRESIKLILRF